MLTKMHVGVYTNIPTEMLTKIEVLCVNRQTFHRVPTKIRERTLITDSTVLTKMYMKMCLVSFHMFFFTCSVSCPSKPEGLKWEL